MSQPVARILIADDEPHVAYVVRYKLERAGYEVFVATNGEESYEIACEESPDAVVTDFQMPRCSGFEMATRLRANPETANIPVILLTARAHKLKPSELAETNIQHVMDKPFSPSDLLEKLQDMLKISGSREAGDLAA